MRRFYLIVAFIFLTACQSQDSASNPESVEDIASLAKRSDDLYNVVCRDGSTEVVSAEDIRSDNVCNGDRGTCSYERRGEEAVFRVLIEDEYYSQEAEYFEGAQYVCGKEISALYDGDELHIFDAAKKAFLDPIGQFIDEGVSNAQIKVQDSILLFWDYDTLHTYNMKEVDSHFGLEDDVELVIGLTGKGAMIYDRDDIFTYCAETNELDSDFSVGDDLDGVTIERRTARSMKLDMRAGGDFFSYDTESCTLIEEIN